MTCSHHIVALVCIPAPLVQILHPCHCKDPARWKCSIVRLVMFNRVIMYVLTTMQGPCYLSDTIYEKLITFLCLLSINVSYFGIILKVKHDPKQENVN